MRYVRTHKQQRVGFLAVLVVLLIHIPWAAAQWSYSGPAFGCTDVLDAFTSNTQSGLTSQTITVSAARFALQGPACHVRGAFAITFNVTAMRAAAVAAGTVPNVSIAVGPGVHFEGLSTAYNMVPTMAVLFAASAQSPFDPDALPVDVVVDNVTWTIPSPVWPILEMYLVTLRNGEHIPRNSRIAVTNTTVTVGQPGADRSATPLSLSFLYIPQSSPFLLLGRSQLVVDRVTITAHAQALKEGLFVLYSNLQSPLRLFDASQLRIANSAVTAINCTTVGVSMLRSHVTLIHSSDSGEDLFMMFNASQLMVENTTVSAIHCSGSWLYLTLLFNKFALPLHDSARLSVTTSTVRAVRGSGSTWFMALMFHNAGDFLTLYNSSQLWLTSSTVSVSDSSVSDLVLALIYLFSSSPLTLHNTSRLVATSCAVTAVNGSGSDVYLSLIHSNSNSPLTLHNTSLLRMANNHVSMMSTGYSIVHLSLIYLSTDNSLTLNAASQMIATKCAVFVVGGRGVVLVGGVVFASSARTVLSGDARMVLDQLALRAEGVAASARLQVFAAGTFYRSSQFFLDVRDRARVLISRSTATVERATCPYLPGQPVASLYNVPNTTLRGAGVVRVCGSVATVTNSTVNGTHYGGAYDGPAASGAAGAVFGAVTPVGLCDMAGAVADRCGVFVSAGARWCLSSVTPTISGSISTTPPQTTSRSPLGTPSGSATVTATSSQRAPGTVSAAPTATATVRDSPSAAFSASASHTTTKKAAPTATLSAALTSTPRPTPTRTGTATPRRSASASQTPTSTATPHHPTATPPTVRGEAERARETAPASMVPAPAEVAVVAVAGTIAATVAADLQAQSALTVSRCAVEAAGGRGQDQSLRALSPFATANTCAGLLQGHAILFGVAVAAMGAAVVVVGVWRRFRGEPTRPVHVVLCAARCPSLLLAVGVFMLTGLVVCGGRGDDGAAQQGLALALAALLSAVGPVLAALLGTRRYVPYAAPPVPKAYRDSAIVCALGKALLPQGTLQAPHAPTLNAEPPAEWSQLLAAAVGAWRLPYPLLGLVPQLSVLALVPALLASGGLCAPLHWASAGLFWACAAAVALLRPRRILVVDVLHGAALAANGALVAAVAAGVSGGAFAQGLAVLQTALTVIRVGHMVLLGLLPRLSLSVRDALHGPAGSVAHDDADNDGGWAYVGWWHRRETLMQATAQRRTLSTSAASAVSLTSLLLTPDADAPTALDMPQDDGTSRDVAITPDSAAQLSDDPARNVSNGESTPPGTPLLLSPPMVPAAVLPPPPPPHVEDTTEATPQPQPRVRMYTSRDLYRRRADVLPTLGVNDPDLLKDVALERRDREIRRRLQQKATELP